MQARRHHQVVDHGAQQGSRLQENLEEALAASATNLAEAYRTIAALRCEVRTLEKENAEACSERDALRQELISIREQAMVWFECLSRETQFGVRHGLV